MTDRIEQVIFDVAEALLVPVLILALLALAVVVYELGAFVLELHSRRRRDYRLLERSVNDAASSLGAGDRQRAAGALRHVAWSGPMGDTLDFIAAHARNAGAEPQVAKALADFDFGSLHRLERTRLLVRAGPALGLMGTLIPLSPALAGLARGDVEELSSNLRVAFSVTVLGLLVGAVAFGLSLVRDRLYGQDLSDLQYVAARLEEGTSA
jgi:biopolymer transport protein ExbB/TolQ